MKADYNRNFLYSQMGGCKMNSHRNNVKDAIKSCFVSFESGDYANELVCEIAVAVFNTLGITEDEQDKCGGYFMLHDAEKVERQFIPPKTALPDGDTGQFSSTMNTSTTKRPEYKEVYHNIEAIKAEENEYTRRTKELAEGAKYTREEFKAYAVGKVVGKPWNPCVWYITLQTPIFGYAQKYSEDYTLGEAKTEFASLYYPMYLEDYERSTDVDKMDEE